ncbi:MAG: molybdenum cofactor biosynthesis protein MoaE [Nitrososphaerota archaeon]|jgi:molybdopterin synthase catalytic subunit|nr:molybdenum cofactor biosynthesis protein MoaE [Nitrososphaerota archaeon]
MVSRAGVHEKGSINVNDIVENIKQREDFGSAGAIGLFIGVVRGETSDGGGVKVEKLTLEAYEEKADEVLGSICDDLSCRPGVVDVQIHHLIGDFSVGDDLVYVAVAGAHREQVFSVLREAVERYKSEVPIFKKEYVISEGGRSECWVSEKQHQHRAVNL